MLLKSVGCPFGYLSTLAKWTNYWRTTNRTKALRSLVMEKFGSEMGALVADALFQSLPARALVGRWGSISDCEAKLMSGMPSEVKFAERRAFCHETSAEKVYYINNQNKK